MRQTTSPVRSTGEGAAFDAATPFPPELRECTGRAARHLLCVLALAFGVLHLPVADASAQTVAPAVQCDGEEPGYAVAGSADERCGSVSPRPVRSPGHPTAGASAHGGTLGAWWPTPACGGNPASDYSVGFLEAEDAPEWRVVILPSVFTVTLKSSSTGRLDMAWSYLPRNE